MNNYCTNCGQKLEKDTIKCKECGTPIINTREIDLNHIKILFRNIMVVVLISTIYIIAFLILPILYEPHAKKQLKNIIYDINYSKIEYKGYERCTRCDSSCDSSCTHAVNIKNCYNYKYDIYLQNGDILADYTIKKVNSTYENTYENVLKLYKIIKNDFKINNKIKIEILKEYSEPDEIRVYIDKNYDTYLENLMKKKKNKIKSILTHNTKMTFIFNDDTEKRFTDS